MNNIFVQSLSDTFLHEEGESVQSYFFAHYDPHNSQLLHFVNHCETLDPLAVFEKFIRYMPQLDIQDRERDNPHRAGPENPWPRPITYVLYIKIPFSGVHGSYLYKQGRRTKAG